MTGSVEQMREHIERLIADRDRPDDHFEVHWVDDPQEAQAAVEVNMIALPRICSAIAYATALHEFGHFYGRHQTSRKCMVREPWAWEWARRNALFWTEEMQGDAEECLAWYAPRAAQIDKGLEPAGK